MSENEIKPVAWTSETQLIALKIGGDGIMADAGQKKWCIPLYDQKSIDRLLEKIDRLEMIEGSWLEFMEKTEWVQKSSEPGELGLHRADVLKSRIDRLTAERDAAVAERGRYFCDGPQGHFFCGDLELARVLVNAYDKDDEWTITDMLNPCGAGE